MDWRSDVARRNTARGTVPRCRGTTRGRFTGRSARRGIIYHDRRRRARRQLCAGPAARSQNRDTAGQISFYYTCGVSAEGSLSAAERAPRVSLLLSSTRLAVSHSFVLSRSPLRTFDAPFTSPTRPSSSLLSLRVTAVSFSPLCSAPRRAAPRRARPRHAAPGNNIVLAGSNGGNVWPTFRAKGGANQPRGRQG